MRKLIQSRLHKPEEGISGNCFATVIACFLDLESPEDCIQIQEHFPEDPESDDTKWLLVLNQWLTERGWEIGALHNHLDTDEYYLVTGPSNRGTMHVCIYHNGRLWHDPHPSGDGIEEELQFEYLEFVGILQ